MRPSPSVAATSGPTLIYVSTKFRRIDHGQGAPSLKQALSLQRTLRQRPQLRDWISIARHRERLATGDAVQDLPAVVPEIRELHARSAGPQAVKEAGERYP